MSDLTDIFEVKRYLDEINCDYSENEPMSRHTSFKIGGPADIFVRPASVDALALAVAKCLECEVPINVIGSGTNLLVSDLGVVGAVIFTGGLADVTNDGSEIIKCMAGAKVSRVCSIALENGLSGLEFAWGIPGSIGGAVYMNAGAYGGEMKNIVKQCTYITRSGELITLENKDIKFGYRSSVFHTNGGIIVSAVLSLDFGDKNEIREKMDDLIGRRKEKQPLEFPSAGSTFKRPEGYFAGTLIEQCGLKGFSVGGAAVSEKHAGFVINKGGATCDDVLRLVDIIKQRVFDETGVSLECEIKMLK